MYMYLMTSFITSRPVCVYSCSQLRELWFNDLFMYLYMYVYTYIYVHIHNILYKCVIMTVRVHVYGCVVYMYML